MSPKPTDKTKNPSPDKRYYRLGLCGLTSGGKTCLLAALSLPRVPHTQGLTASLVPLDRNSSQDLQEGWDWIEKAKSGLIQGGIPSPNPHTGDRLSLRYKFTDENRQERFIELVDYSGELLDPRVSQSDLADNLRKYFNEVDGFLFIAEHSMPGEKNENIASYLQNLEQALAMLRENARKKDNLPSVPIALLINKWDRAGSLSKEDGAYEKQLEVLEAFLNTSPKPPHATLLAALEAASEGACKAFPVSAFGNAVLEATEKPGEYKEIPAQVIPQLPAFGIDEPFLWLAEQCDLADITRMKREISRPAAYLDILATCGSIWRWNKNSLRIPRMSPPAIELRKNRRKLLGRLSIQAVIYFLICLTIELLWDSWKYRQALASLSDTTDPAGWTKAESWYSGYIGSAPYWSFLHKRIILTNQQAANELDDAREKRESIAWKAVEINNDPSVQVRLAEEFLAKYPQSKRMALAQQIIEEFKVSIEKQKFEAKIIAHENKLASIQERVRVEQQKNEAIQDFKSIASELSILQRDIQSIKIELVDDNLNTRLNVLSANTGKIMAQISRILAHGEDRKKYHELASLGKWKEAADFLVGLPAADYKDLRDHFRTKALPGLESVANNECGNGAGWQKAIEYLRDFQKEPIRGLLAADSIDKFKRLEMRYKQSGDKWLYSACQPNAGVEPFRRYLEEAPLQTMQKVAEEWIHFLNLRQNPGRYRMGVSRIKWGAKARNADRLFDDENRIIIKLDGARLRKTVRSNRKDDWNAKGQSFKVIKNGLVANKPQRIEIDLIDVDWPDPNDCLGKISVMKLPEEVHGLQLVLKGSDYGDNTVILSMEVLDGDKWRRFARPSLPAWTAQR